MKTETDLQVIPAGEQRPVASGALTLSPARLALGRPTIEVLKDAAEVADALMQVIQTKKKPVIMNGEQYIEFEDWQLIANFFECAPKVTACDLVQITRAGKTSTGFKATADLVHVPSGRVVSSAVALCMDDEEKWSTRPKYAWAYVLADGSKTLEDPGPGGIVWVPNPNKPGKNMPKKERTLVGEDTVPIYQLMSMAQTRASAKVCREVFSHIVTKAGFRPTPAEEIDADPVPAESPLPPPAPPTQAAPPPPKTAPAAQGAAPPPSGGKVISTGQLKRFWAKVGEHKWDRERQVPFMLNKEFGMDNPEFLAMGAAYDKAIAILVAGPEKWAESHGLLNKPAAPAAPPPPPFKGATDDDIPDNMYDGGY